MADPTLPTISDVKTAALQAAGVDTEYGTGINYPTEGITNNSTPAAINQLTQQHWRMAMRLAGWMNCAPVDLTPETAGLNIGVNEGTYKIGSTVYDCPGSASFALTDDETNYVYLDADETIKKSTTAFPDDSWRIATVVCASGNITTFADVRMQNFQVGVASAWYDVTAAGDVDMAGYDLDDVGRIKFNDATELTIASGVITITQGNHTVDVEGGVAASDELTTINGGTEGDLLIIRPASADRTIQVMGEEDNIFLNPAFADGTYDMDAATDMLLLVKRSDTEWQELGRSYSEISEILGTVLNLGGLDLTTVGVLNFSPASAPTELTIATGAVAVTNSIHTIDTEGDGVTDDLDTATGGTYNDLLVLRPANTGRTVIVKHSTDATKFELANGLDFSMDSSECQIGFLHDGTNWKELFRTPIRPMDLRITSDPETDAVPVLLGTFHFTGAFAAGTHDERILVPFDCTFNRATGIVLTAPSGGACIVDVQVDSGGGFGSIFAADAARIFIEDGTYSDVSHTVATMATALTLSAGDILAVAVTNTDSSPHSAEDLTVQLWANAPMQAGE